MKKLFAILFTLIIFIGCNNQDKKLELDDPNDEVSVSEYYDIIIEQLNSDKVGKVSGEGISSYNDCCDSQHIYEGEVSNGIVDYKVSYTNELGEEDKYEVSLSVNSSENRIDVIGKGITSISDIDVELCEVNDNTLVCSMEGIMKHDTYIDGFKKEFTFTFEENKKLTSISVSHLDFTISYLDQGNVDDDLLDLASEFKNTENYELFTELGDQVIFRVYEETEIVQY